MPEQTEPTWLVKKTGLLSVLVITMMIVSGVSLALALVSYAGLDIVHKELNEVVLTKTEKENALKKELAKYKALKFGQMKQLIQYVTNTYTELREDVDRMTKVAGLPKFPGRKLRLQYLVDDLQVLKYQIAMLAQFVHQLHACRLNKLGLCKTVDGSQMWKWLDYTTLRWDQYELEAKIASEARDEADEECEKKTKNLRFVVKKLRKDVHEMERSMQ